MRFFNSSLYQFFITIKSVQLRLRLNTNKRESSSGRLLLNWLHFIKSFVINKKYFFKNMYIFLTVISNLNLFLSIGNIQFHLLKNGIAMFYIGLVS